MDFSNLTTGEIVAIGLLVMLAWLIIMYQIIKDAVRSALQKQEYYLRALYRMEIAKMMDRGYSKEELSTLQDRYDDVYWEKLEVKKEAGTNI